MNNIIQTAHNKPFKLERHALNAIKDMPGYTIEKRDNGYVGVFSKKEIAFEIKARGLASKMNIIEDYQLGIIKIKKGKMPTVSDFSGYDVFCPSCGLSHYTTTEVFDPDVDVNPAMIDMKPQYKEWGWEQLPKDSSMGYGCITCPECAMALAPSGRVRVNI